MNDGQRSARTTARKGFNSYNQAVNDRPTFVFKKGDETTHMLAFLEPENFTWAKRHWVDIIDPESGKRRTTVKNCLQTEDDEGNWIDERGCPICAVGEDPSVTCYFNVVDLDGNRNKVLVWEASVLPTNGILKRYQQRKANGKLISDPDIYYAVSKEDGPPVKFNIDPVKASDMAEEWPSVVPLSDDQRARLMGKLYDETYVRFPTYEELEEFVALLA